MCRIWNFFNFFYLVVKNVKDIILPERRYPSYPVSLDRGNHCGFYFSLLFVTLFLCVS